MIFELPHNKDKFGYYIVGDHKTYSKVEAIELAVEKRRIPVWHFNDEVFSLYNWKIEPKESLTELYAKRAKQIREKYDHIVLFYSGGADSGNVLDSFVDNNIPFEEVATYNYWNLDSRQDCFFHAEQIKVSYPKIKQLQDQGINFKHRPIDLSEMAYQVFVDPFWMTHRAYYGNGHWGTTHVAKTYIREKIEDYKKIIDSGKKLVFVWGCEKPRIFLDNHGKYLFKFVDMMDNGPGTRNQLLNRPWEHDELFYCSPECPQLLIKQAHTLKNFFSQHKEVDLHKIWCDDKINLPDIGQMFDNDVTEDGLSHRNLLNWLIYPKFNIRMFSMGKPACGVYSLRDQRWLDDIVFRKQIDNLADHFRTLDRRWWRDPDDIEKGLKFFYSRPYQLE
jgi:hypothetical protein